MFAATAVGFFAGLFGIGGGLISVPCLFFIFETLNFDKNYLMHLTVGTAFTFTIFTSTYLSYIIGFMTGVINNRKAELRTIDDKEDYERSIKYYLKD